MLMPQMIQTEQVDFSNLLNILKLKRWFILTITALAFSISALYVFRLPNVYTAKETILVEMIDDAPLKYQEVMIPRHSEATFYRTQLELLTGREILEQTIEDLDLLHYYAKYNPRIRSLEDTVNILRKSVLANLLRSTHIIQLSVTDRDPQMAAKIASQLSNNFIKESLRARLFISDQLLQWFPDEATTLKNNSPIEQLRKLEADDDMKKSLPSVSQDPVVQKLKQERIDIDAQMREFSSRYTPEHPKMKELWERAKYLESEMNLQSETIVRSVKAGLAGQFNVTNIRIVDKAKPSQAPSGPRRFFIIGLATLLAFFAAAFAAFVQNHLDQNIKSEEDVKKINGLSFLGYVPLIKTMIPYSEDSEDIHPNLLQCLSQDHRILDSVIGVRTAVVFSMPAERSKTLMCTSSIPNEGKTTVTALLAMSLADLGEKVAVIDADLRKPAMHKVFGLDNERGLSNYLIGAAVARDLMQSIPQMENLQIMTAGETVPNPTTLLNSNGILNLIRDLSEFYDRIIFDAPPSLHIPDGIILAQRLHGTILVFGAGMIHHAVGAKLKEKFDKVSGNVIGAVVNRAKLESLNDGYGYYQYYRKYNRYYEKAKI